MRKRKQGGLANDLFGIAAALPWWAGVALAIISYFIIHRYAVAEVPTAAATKQVGQMVTGQLVKTMAFYGQYVVPLLFLGGAIASFFGRKKRESLVRDAADGNATDVIQKMTWQDFELFVGELFRMRGFAVAENGGGGADGGIDLTLRRGEEVFLVQCKRWREFKVSVNVVRELYGVMAAQRVAGGFVVTSGVFTPEAVEFSRGRSIELIDGVTLAKMLPAEKKSLTHTRQVQTTPAEVVAPALTPITTVTNVAHACPRCGSAMIQRVAKKGPTTGQFFWGCTEFPKCAGTRKFE